MDYTIIITLLFLFVGGYFVYTIIQRQRQFQQICSDEHLYEIRDTFAELYEEVWEEFLQKQKDAEEKIGLEDTSQEKINPNMETVDLDRSMEGPSQQKTEDTTKYRLTSKNFLITYTVTPIQLKNKKLIFDHLSFSSVNQFFFPRNLVYMAVYFSILLDVKPETFDYVVHQANKGTSGFLFCKSDRNGELEQHKKNLCLLIKEDSEEEIEDNIVEEKKEENQEKKNQEDSSEDTVIQLSLKELRKKIEELSPHIQIQKV